MHDAHAKRDDGSGFSEFCAFAVPDHLTFAEFCGVFEAETLAEHVAWRHNIK